MDSARLAALFDAIDQRGLNLHSVLVIRNGYLVTGAYFASYGPEIKQELMSVTKSVSGMLTGIAVSQGHIQSTSESVLSFFPNRTIANSDDNKRKMTLENLLTLAAVLSAVGAVSLGTLKAANPVDVAVLVLTAATFIGFWPGPCRPHKIWMGIAIALPLAGIAVLLATGLWGRSGLMGGGLVLSFLMLSDRACRPLGFLGIAANSLLLVGDFATDGSSAPAIAALVAVGYVLLLVWFVWIAVRLLSAKPSLSQCRADQLTVASSYTSTGLSRSEIIARRRNRDNQAAGGEPARSQQQPARHRARRRHQQQRQSCRHQPRDRKRPCGEATAARAGPHAAARGSQSAAKAWA